MYTNKCPDCNSELQCLGGASAHPLNWYCSDEKNCGWTAWKLQPTSKIDQKAGVWFQSAETGLWYTNYKSAGDILFIKIDGKMYKSPEIVMTEEAKDYVRINKKPVNKIYWFYCSLLQRIKSWLRYQFSKFF